MLNLGETFLIGITLCPGPKVNTKVAKYSHIQERASNEQPRIEVRKLLIGFAY